MIVEVHDIRDNWLKDIEGSYAEGVFQYKDDQVRFLWFKFGGTDKDMSIPYNYCYPAENGKKKAMAIYDGKNYIPINPFGNKKFALEAGIIQIENDIKKLKAEQNKPETTNADKVAIDAEISDLTAEMQNLQLQKSSTKDTTDKEVKDQEDRSLANALQHKRIARLTAASQVKKPFSLTDILTIVLIVGVVLATMFNWLAARNFSSVSSSITTPYANVTKQNAVLVHVLLNQTKTLYNLTRSVCTSTT